MEEFLKNVEKTPDGCWIWNGPTCGTGRYGRVLGKRKFHMAHRLSYQLFHGVNPGEKFVCHRCDNGLCVNPSHLFLGSARDNVLDMVKKGRAKGIFPRGCQSGESNANCKLNRLQVEEIRRFQADNKYSYGQLAKHFGLRSKGHAHAIVTGRLWK